MFPLLHYSEANLFHDDVLVEQFSLLCLLIDRDLGHQDLARVVDEVAHCLLLLSAFVQVLDCLGPSYVALLR